MLFCKNLEATPWWRRAGTSRAMPDKSTTSDDAASTQASATPETPAVARKIYAVVKYGDPILEKPTKPVVQFDDQLAELAEDMIVLVNPQLVHAEGEKREEEGCLSIPGFRGYVVRPQFVTVRAQDLKGQSFEIRGEDLLARAFC